MAIQSIDLEERANRQDTGHFVASYEDEDFEVRDGLKYQPQKEEELPELNVELLAAIR